MPCMKVEPSTQDRTRSDFFNSHISPDARRRYTPMEDTRVAALENSIVRLVWLRRWRHYDDHAIHDGNCQRAIKP